MDDERLLCLMDTGSSRVFHTDGRLYGPHDPREGKQVKNESTKRRLAALEKRVRELGGNPGTRPEDVDLGFEVHGVWAENDAPDTAENEDGALGFEVRDLWVD